MRLSKEGRRVDALALRADERRDKLRKASGRSKYPLIRRYLNGETHWSTPPVSIRQSITYGGEPGELKHLRSRRPRKKPRFRKERRANAEEPKPGCVHPGVRTAGATSKRRGMVLGKPPRGGERPVPETRAGAAGSRVPRDTRNLVGRSGDHPVRLNTT